MTQAHLVRTVPERGAGVQLDQHEWFVVGAVQPHHHAVAPPVHPQRGSRFHGGFLKTFPIFLPCGQEEYPVGQPNDFQRDHGVRRWGFGCGPGLLVVFLRS